MSCKTWTCYFFNSTVLLCWINKEGYAWKYCKTSSVRYQTTQGLNICNWLDKLQNSFEPRHFTLQFLQLDGHRQQKERWLLTRNEQTASSRPGTTWRDLTSPKHTEHAWVLLPFKPSPPSQLHKTFSRLSFFLAMLCYLKLHASHYSSAHNSCCISFHASIWYFEQHEDKSIERGEEKWTFPTEQCDWKGFIILAHRSKAVSQDSWFEKRVLKLFCCYLYFAKLYISLIPLFRLGIRF